MEKTVTGGNNPLDGVEPMLLTFKGHMYEAEIGRVLRGETQMGRLVKDTALRLLRFDEVKNAVHYREWDSHTVRAFEETYGFLRDRDLSGLELTRDDIIFLITTGVGNVLRRPICHTSLAQRIGRDVKAESDKARVVKEKLVGILKGAGWSKFVENGGTRKHIAEKYGGEGILVDMAQAVADLDSNARESDSPRSSNKSLREFEAKLLREKERKRLGEGIARLLAGYRGLDDAIGTSRSALADILVQALDVAEDYSKNADKASDTYPVLFGEGGKWFFTDPKHAFNQHLDVGALMGFTKLALEGGETGELARESTLMVFEDNPVHQCVFRQAANGGVKNLTMYHPKSFPEAADEHQRTAEARGLYASARRGLEVIEANGSPPDIVMADCELADGITGPWVVREIKRRWPQVKVCMMYSSSELNMAEMRRLRDEGIIDMFWHKDEFSLKRMVDAANEKLTPK